MRNRLPRIVRGAVALPADLVLALAAGGLAEAHELVDLVLLRNLLRLLRRRLPGCLRLLGLHQTVRIHPAQTGLSDDLTGATAAAAHHSSHLEFQPRKWTK